MDTWEYQATVIQIEDVLGATPASVTSVTSVTSVNEALSALGGEGWELAAMQLVVDKTRGTRAMFCIFRRSTTPTAPNTPPLSSFPVR